MTKYLILAILFIGLFTSCKNEIVIPEDEIPIMFPWENGTYQELGMDSTLLASAIQKAGRFGYINSILVIRHAKIAAEQYFNGYIRIDAHNTASAAKSILSALIGIAIEQNILSLEDKMMDFFPEYSQPTLDSLKYQITIEQLLTMKGGLKSENEIGQTLSYYDDQIAGIIYIPLDTIPGNTFHYTSLGTHLLSGILTKASGVSSLQFLNDNMLIQMGISIEGWIRDPRGIFYGGSSMYFTPRNLAVFGLLYLNHGRINGQQIVSEEWIEKSLTNYCFPPGESWEEIENLGYGYLWWLGELENHKVFFAEGYAGQFIFCIPDFDLIIVTLTDDLVLPSQAEKQEADILDIIVNDIVPSITN